MKPRIDATNYMGSGAARAMLRLQHEVESSGLDRPLIELVKIRASQMNGCAYCIDMHTKDARAMGETGWRSLSGRRREAISRSRRRGNTLDIAASAR
jgi:AhpD family alkylhydroperoxidase